MSDAQLSVTQQFAQGLFGHSKTSIWVAIAFILLTAGAALVFVDEDFIYSDFHHYLAAQRVDERLFISERANAFSNSGNAQPKLVVLGGSATLVSIRNSTVTSTIDHEYYKLAWSRQSLIDSLFLISRVPEGSKGLLLIGVGPSRFSLNRQNLERRFKNPGGGFTSELFDEEITKYDFVPRDKTGNFVIDNRQFLFARYRSTLRNLVLGAPQQPKEYFPDKKQNEKAFARASTIVKNRIDRYEDSVGLNLDLLTTIIRLVRDRTEMDIVLVEHPINPRFLREYIGEAFYEDHKQRVAVFADDNGVTYLDLAPEILDEGSYFDWTHLGHITAAEDYTNRLLNELENKGLLQTQ